MDGLWTLRDLLTRHKHFVSQFLVRNYERIFHGLNSLIKSKDYVVVRQTLEILETVLNEEKNYQFKTLYINNMNNSKIIKNLLWNDWKHIRLRAFVIFKLIMENDDQKFINDFLEPKDKLIEALQDFKRECVGDRMFKEQEVFVHQIINDIKLKDSIYQISE